MSQKYLSKASHRYLASQLDEEVLRAYSFLARVCTSTTNYEGGDPVAPLLTGTNLQHWGNWNCGGFPDRLASLSVYVVLSRRCRAVPDSKMRTRTKVSLRLLVVVCNSGREHFRLNVMQHRAVEVLRNTLYQKYDEPTLLF